VRTQYSLFKWSRLLNSWLKCISVFEKGTSPDITSLEPMNVVECVCHGQGDAEEGFFYVYMCHFSQLHMRIPFSYFIMGVLRLFNIVPF